MAKVKFEYYKSQAAWYGTRIYIPSFLGHDAASLPAPTPDDRKSCFSPGSEERLGPCSQ